MTKPWKFWEPAPNLSEQKQKALDALDRLLSVQVFPKSHKIKAIREIEKAAKRMADFLDHQERMK